MQNSFYQINCRHYASFTALDKLLKSVLPVRLAGNHQYLRKLLDTFDWRIFNAGCLLEEECPEKQRLLRLRSIQPEPFVIEQPMQKTPEFYRDIPPGRLQDTLKKLLKERALLDMGSLEVRTRHYELRDNLDKILLRLVVTGVYRQAAGNRGKGIDAWLEIHPLRGYEDEAEKVRKRLFDEHQFNHCSIRTVAGLYEALGKTPGDYNSKMDITLDPDMPCYAALSSVLLYNLDIMERNVEGIKEDIDIEFLHDFRVSNRRSRSLATQIKNVYPPRKLARFKNAFKWLSKATSTHRDLDVFLADFSIYAQKIPDDRGADLDILREFLLKNRQKEHRRLLRALGSRRFETFKHDWRSFLEGKPASNRPENAMSPVTDVASRSIWKGYKKLMKEGDAIKTNYTFESIHQLRKDGKKLRYLLEAFRSLYPKEDLSQVVKSMKKLQNNLGDIVDMHIQRAMLEEWKQAMQDSAKIPQTTIDAMDYLQNLCTEEEKKAEKKFIKIFTRFSSKANKKLFRDLFK